MVSEVPEHQDILRGLSNTLMIKVSPFTVMADRYPGL